MEQTEFTYVYPSHHSDDIKITILGKSYAMPVREYMGAIDYNTAYNQISRSRRETLPRMTKHDIHPLFGGYAIRMTPDVKAQQEHSRTPNGISRRFSHFIANMILSVGAYEDQIGFLNRVEEKEPTGTSTTIRPNGTTGSKRIIGFDELIGDKSIDMKYPGDFYHQFVDSGPPCFRMNEGRITRAYLREPHPKYNSNLSYPRGFLIPRKWYTKDGRWANTEAEYIVREGYEKLMDELGH